MKLTYTAPDGEPWTIYTLSDGTEVKVKSVLVSAHRRADFDELGNPKYDLGFQQIINVDCPDSLKLSLPEAQPGSRVN